MLIIGRRCGNVFFFFQAEDGIRDLTVTGVQTCALPIFRLPVTLELVVLSMAVAIAIAVPAAVVASVRQNTWGDYTAMIIALAGVSIPEFFLGVLLLQIGRASCRERV